MSISIEQVSSQFCFVGDFIYGETFGCGHINSTYAVYYRTENHPPVRYILQKINTDIFDPDMLMSNIKGVTDYLHKLITKNGGDPSRETLTIIPTKDGQSYYRDAEGGCWRAYVFIENTIAYQSVDSPVTFYNAGRAFGEFQKKLAGFNADSLYEIIPKFHDTGKRLNDLKAAVAADKAGRVASVKEEIDFCLSREADCSIVTTKIAEGKLPLRVTHNDTKLNNILIDENTKKGLCIIDLDTIMPGSVLYDFGDSIRFGASTAAEDETDLDKVSMSLELFESYAKGFLEEAGAKMTEEEKNLLAFSAKLMTLECGIRFLTDYLDGDHYFHISRPNHNLDRARNQFKLVKDMEEKMDLMEATIKNL